MSRIRLIFFIAVVIAGGALSVLLYRAEIVPPLDATLAPAFQLIGRPVKSFDRALTRVLPIDAVDEAEYGDAIARRYEPYSGGTPAQAAYVQTLLTAVSQSGHKGFRYRSYLLETDEANAFALPGGVVVVTTGLLSTVQSESELVSVLAHEVGHVELSHCLDSVRFEILSRKLGSASLGELADLAMNVMMRHSYSKTQEEEADEYAWAYILQSTYDPSGEGLAFQRLSERYGLASRSGRTPHPVAEYFQSHPHLELRQQRYQERAGVWWMKHEGERRYVGRHNLKGLTPMSADSSDESEWAHR